MALTATAIPDVVDGIKSLLRHPHVVQASVNRPNNFICMQKSLSVTNQSLQQCNLHVELLILLARPQQLFILTSYRM